MTRPVSIARSLLFVLPVALQSMATAGEHGSHDGGDGSGELESAHEHDYHRNVVGVFLGVTSEERRETSPTFGIEYERRLSPSFGLGVLLEHARGDLDFTIAAIPFAYHHGHWKLYAAPGVEFSDEDYDTEFLMRVGVEYAFELGRGFEVSPQVDLDFVDGEVVTVLGLTFAYGF
jgi:hypothetical protein